MLRVSTAARRLTSTLCVTSAISQPFLRPLLVSCRSDAVRVLSYARLSALSHTAHSERHHAVEPVHLLHQSRTLTTSTEAYNPTPSHASSATPASAVAAAAPTAPVLSEPGKEPRPENGSEPASLPTQRRDIFSFSGSGWLLTYHIGVSHRLVEAGRFREHTRFVGASGGALIGALLACCTDPEYMLLDLLAMAASARHQKRWMRIRDALYALLMRRLPADAHVQCSGRLTVALTRVWPRPRLRPILQRRYESREMLITTVLASCMVPTLFESGLTAKVGSNWIIDGGIYHLVPRLAGTTKVSPFAPPFMRSQGVRVDICPSLTPGFPYKGADLYTLCFTPPTEAQLLDIYDWGRRAAETWLAESDRGYSECEIGRPLLFPKMGDVDPSVAML